MMFILRISLRKHLVQDIWFTAYRGEYLFRLNSEQLDIQEPRGTPGSVRRLTDTVPERQYHALDLDIIFIRNGGTV